MLSKTFRSSKKMMALVLVAAISTIVVLAAFVLAYIQPSVMNAAVLQITILTYGGALAAVATAAVATQGVVGDKHDSLVKIASMQQMPTVSIPSMWSSRDEMPVGVVTTSAPSTDFVVVTTKTEDKT